MTDEPELRRLSDPASQHFWVLTFKFLTHYLSLTFLLRNVVLNFSQMNNGCNTKQHRDPVCLSYECKKSETILFYNNYMDTDIPLIIRLRATLI